MPFHDLRSVPESYRSREHVENNGRACTQVLFISKAELGFFHFLRNSGRLAGTFHRSRSRLLKRGFFRAGDGAENTKEKSRLCFMIDKLLG
jgi:hypothetical protein